MGESMDLDDLLEFWKVELEDDGAQLDVMRASCRPPIQNVRTVGVSYKVMLAEVVKGLPAFDPLFSTWSRYGGFYSNVRVLVPDLVIPVKLHEEFCSSGDEFSTAEKDEEKAAEGMIRTLERKYNFETKDLNWWDKRRFNLESYHFYSGWRRVEEENQALKMKVDALKKGWRYTLESVDRACDIADSADIAGTENVVSAALFEGISEFEKIVDKY